MYIFERTIQKQEVRKQDLKGGAVNSYVPRALGGVK